VSPRTKAKDGSWLYPTTRWAIYLRDGLACVYCGITMDEILADDGLNFFSVDHVRARCRGGTREPTNLVTCCYDCNVIKSTLSLKAFCFKQGFTYERVRSRIRKRRVRDIERYRESAKILLGLTNWAPLNQKVEDHDFLVKRQWSNDGNIELADWEHLQAQQKLFCPTCGHPHEREPPPVLHFEDEFPF